MGDEDDDDDTQKLIITKLIRKAYKPATNSRLLIHKCSTGSGGSYGGDGDGDTEQRKDIALKNMNYVSTNQPTESVEWILPYLGCCLINCDL